MVNEITLNEANNCLRQIVDCGLVLIPWGDSYETYGASKSLVFFDSAYVSLENPNMDRVMFI